MNHNFIPENKIGKLYLYIKPLMSGLIFHLFKFKKLSRITCNGDSLLLV